MAGDWIKLHRSIWGNPILAKDPCALSVWIWILCHANYVEKDVIFRRKRQKLSTGQLFVTVSEIGSATGVSKSKINRTIKILKSESQIETEVDRWGTLITVVNWEKYQESETEVGTEVKRKWNGSETEVKNLHYIKKERKKEVKNIGKSKTGVLEALVDNFTMSQEVRDLLLKFIEMRRRIKKPLTEKGMEIALNKLSGLAMDDEKRIAIINESVEKDWLSFYPLKEERANKGKTQTQQSFDEVRAMIEKGELDIG